MLLLYTGYIHMYVHVHCMCNVHIYTCTTTYMYMYVYSTYCNAYLHVYIVYTSALYMGVSIFLYVHVHVQCMYMCTSPSPGVFLHILADTLGSVGVIISSTLIYHFGELTYTTMYNVIIITIDQEILFSVVAGNCKNILTQKLINNN